MTYQSHNFIKCIQCNNPQAVARKLCRRCYNVARKQGLLASYPILGPQDVFENRINKTKTCWLWTGSKNGYGYGIFQLPGEIKVRAHRYSYEFYKEKIPDGMIVMHTCDNPPCVNPSHLRIGTKDDNNKDTAIKRRHNYGIDHWNGRLTNKQVSIIRRSKKSQAELARKYKVSQSHICRIKSKEARPGN